MMKPAPHLAKNVGARLRELRLDAELTLQQVARRMDSHKEIVGRIERGVHTPSMDTITRYARALELDVPTVLAFLSADDLRPV